MTFWLSNTVVVREIIAQTFGVSRVNPTMMTMNMNDGAKKLDGKPMTMPDDWQETSTFLASLEKIESWIFSRIVDTVWWQVNICFLIIDSN